MTKENEKNFQLDLTAFQEIFTYKSSWPERLKKEKEYLVKKRQGQEQTKQSGNSQYTDFFLPEDKQVQILQVRLAAFKGKILEIEHHMQDRPILSPEPQSKAAEKQAQIELEQQPSSVPPPTRSSGDNTLQMNQDNQENNQGNNQEDSIGLDWRPTKEYYLNQNAEEEGIFQEDIK